MKSICLYSEIPERYRKHFPKDRGGNDSSPPHVTVLYVGAVEDQDVSKIIKIVEDYTKNAKPAKCQFGKYNQFPQGIYGTPHYVEVRGDRNLYKLHYDLWHLLEMAGLSVDHEYKGDGYIPHATLQHLPKGEDYSGSVPKGSFTLDSVTVGIY